MANFNMQAAIVAKIDEVAGAEKTVKQLLSELSRELLAYVPDTNDVGMVNRLTNVLTPMNKATALSFFKHFLPWQTDDTGSTFTKKDTSEKRTTKKLAAIKEFLEDPEADIWTWAERNVEVKKKDFNLADNIKKAVELALKGKEASKKTNAAEPIAGADVIRAVISAGVKAEDIINVIAEIAEAAKGQEEESEAEAA